MEKYELREGDEYISEHTDDAGTHITVLKDKNCVIKHGWVMDIDNETIWLLTQAAESKGIPVEDYVDKVIEDAIILQMEEEKMRKAIEEISD